MSHIKAQAEALIQEKRVAAAAPMLEAVLKEHPSDAGSRTLLGICKFRMKNYGAAETEFRQSVAIEPRNDNAWYYRGLCLERLNRQDEAITMYNVALSVNPDFSEAKRKLSALGAASASAPSVDAAHQQKQPISVTADPTTISTKRSAGPVDDGLDSSVAGISTFPKKGGQRLWPTALYSFGSAFLLWGNGAALLAAIAMGLAGAPAGGAILVGIGSGCLIGAIFGLVAATKEVRLVRVPTFQEKGQGEYDGAPLSKKSPVNYTGIAAQVRRRAEQRGIPPRTLNIIEFRLQRASDLFVVPVQMAGYKVSGSISDGDKIVLTGTLPKRGSIYLTNRLYNETTGIYVRTFGGNPATVLSVITAILIMTIFGFIIVSTIITVN